MKRLSLLILTLVFFTASALSQNTTLRQRVHRVDIDSGVKANPSANEAVVFSQWVDTGEAPWVRLLFESAQLQGGSYLRIVSLTDGSTQILDREGLGNWRNSTAYFNGPIVSVELVAAPGTTENSVSIRRVLAGEVDQTEANPITRVCAAADNRALSANAATARLLVSPTEEANPIGCTGFIIDRSPAGDMPNRCMLSAGHCFDPGDPPIMTVAQFDVPASLANCNIQMPGANKQFPIPAGAQFRNNGPGDDWAVFIPQRNAMGNTVFQVQNAQFSMAPPAAIAASKFGYGTTGNPNVADPPIDIHCVCHANDARAPQNMVQQTSAGAITAVNPLTFAVDHNLHTCGGDSGAPVIQQRCSLGTFATAIHTQGACNGLVPTNAGTSIVAPNLVAAINNLCPPPPNIKCENFAGGNLVRNCGFETGNLAPWVASGDLSFSLVSPRSAHTGAFGYEAGPVGTLGFIAQMIPTTQDASYDLLFWLRNMQRPNQFQVYWGGQLIYDQADEPDFEYLQRSFPGLLGTGDCTELKFGFFNVPDWFFIDDIIVAPSP